MPYDTLCQATTVHNMQNVFFLFFALLFVAGMSKFPQLGTEKGVLLYSVIDIEKPRPPFYTQPIEWTPEQSSLD